MNCKQKNLKSLVPTVAAISKIATIAKIATMMSIGLSVVISQTAFAETGVTEKGIKIGMVTALTGPAQKLGQGMKTGVESYFNHVNKTGGINGRKLSLVAVDDGYEPKKTAPAMRKLIKKNKVFAIIGNVGTPTAIVSVPIANESKVPFFGAFTGAGVLRKTPPDRYIINYRASYAQETAAMVNGFVKDLGIKPEEIAFFTQNDGYGDAGYKGGIEALKKLGSQTTRKNPHGRYTRNTTDIESGLLTILDAKITPKAIIMVGAYKPCAAFIKLAKEEGLKAIFANVSFVGSKALAKELGNKGASVVVTQVVPYYENSAYPAVKEYLSIVPAKSQGFVSLEGFLAAKSMVLGLRKAGKNLTKESFIDAIESLGDFDLGLNTKHHLSKTQHQISQTVWPTMIENEKFRSFAWKEAKKNYQKFFKMN